MRVACYWSRNMPTAASGCEGRPARALSIRRRTSVHVDGASKAQSSRGRAGHRQTPAGQSVTSEEAALEADGQVVDSCPLASCPPSWTGVSLSRARLWMRDQRFRVGSSLVYSHGSSEGQASCSIYPCSTLWKMILTVWRSGSSRAQPSGCGEKPAVRQLLRLDRVISAYCTARAGLGRATIAATISGGDREGWRGGQAETRMALPGTLWE